MMNYKNVLMTMSVTMVVATGCQRNSNTTSEGKASEKVVEVDDIPLPVVGDATSNLLFSYVGKAGQMVSVGSLDDVPQKAKERVLVVDLSRTPQERMAHRYAFFADLTQKNAEGRYPVSVVSRYQSAKGEGPPAGLMPSSTADIVVYSAVWCGFCHKLERWLKERGTPYQKKDVEKDPGADRELKAKLAQAGITSGGVPVTDVAGNMVVGFNKAKLTKLIDSWEQTVTPDNQEPDQEKEKKK